MFGRKREFRERMDRLDRNVAEILASIDRNSEDTRLYIRESGIRFERAMQATERRMQRLEEESIAWREESRYWRGRIQAQTEAIWKLLDKWGEGPRPEPA